MTTRLAAPTMLVAILLLLYSGTPTPESGMSTTWTAGTTTLRLCGGCNAGSPHSFSSGTILRTCDDQETGCHGDPKPGTCTEWHGDCGSELMANLTIHASQLLDAGNLGELRTFLADHADRVVYNADRHAVQFTWCDGLTIAAHLPVTREQLRVLTE